MLSTFRDTVKQEIIAGPTTTMKLLALEQSIMI